MSATHFVAADVGNARVKLGLFAADGGDRLPEPLRTLPLLGKEPELDLIEPWLARQASPLTWWIASVNRPAATRLIDWLHEHRANDVVVLLACGDLPLEVRLERPDMVGVDRLVDAVAVNRLREPARPAVIVDVGTAITVDLVAADGAFCGGSILPGIQMSARALHHFTDLLPLLNVSDLTSPPPALGTSTESAMRAGLFWGAVGAIRQLIEELCKAATIDRVGKGGNSTDVPTNEPAPQVFLTGGAGIVVADLLGHETHFVPNLTLSGIAQTAMSHRGATIAGNNSGERH
jgi:type III pantothenate kinase